MPLPEIHQQVHMRELRVVQFCRHSHEAVAYHPTCEDHVMRTAPLSPFVRRKLLTVVIISWNTGEDQGMGRTLTLAR